LLTKHKFDSIEGKQYTQNRLQRQEYADTKDSEKIFFMPRKKKPWGMTWKFEHSKNKGSALFIFHLWHTPFTPIYCSCVWTQIQLSPVSKDNDLPLQ